MTRPLASLSLDLDNKWSYLKTHDSDGWQDFPSYLPELIPIILDFTSSREIDLTVFVVGQDAALEKNADAFALLGASPHEIGNHSFHHEPWLHLNSRAQVEDELISATDAIVAATGRTPYGFRGPGYSLSATTLDVLAELGYSYDASTFPTFTGPLLRAYYLRTSDLADDEKERRGKLFGGFNEGFRSLRPYRWATDSGAKLLEIPVTTLPLLRLPIHATYLHYLAGYSEALARSYLRLFLGACRWANLQPSFLLHSTDFLGGDEVRGLDFFPAMDQRGELKRDRVALWVDMIRERHEVTSVGTHADALGNSVTPVKLSSAL